ncbi:MAG TPA: TldD/PmbA family protein [Firmicutes bacterium]|nr:TldD/PmbA family protein [Candidatus Fermentithermobacillaceae bacterium]
MLAELNRILGLAQKLGAEYADARYVSITQEPISVSTDGAPEVSVSRSTGLGLRVLVDGAWGFAATPYIDPRSLEKTADEAVKIAYASALRKKGDGVSLTPLEPKRARWQTPCKVDPFSVKPEEKVEFLTDVVKAAKEIPGVFRATATIMSYREEKQFMSTDGREIEQTIVHSGGSVAVMARGEGDVQSRSFADYAGGGFEFVESLDLKAQAEKLAQEAVELLKAPVCPTGVTDIVMGGSMVALQIHESCGHPIELDRVVGQEATFAGTSFLTPEKKGSFRYGSECVNIVADATLPGGLGSFGFDDEGVEAQRVDIVREGIFTDYLTSRELAPMFGQESNGTMRAVGWENIPLIRMTNINLEPGDWTLDEIIKDTKEGIFVDTPKSWSLDDKRLNFHFGQEIAYEIKDGSLGKMLKNPAYTGMTPEFWNSCDAVAGKDEWRIWGTPGCAKGEPVQVVHVGHGAAPARFRKVKVGVGA